MGAGGRVSPGSPRHCHFTRNVPGLRGNSDAGSRSRRIAADLSGRLTPRCGASTTSVTWRVTSGRSAPTSATLEAERDLSDEPPRGRDVKLAVADLALRHEAAVVPEVPADEREPQPAVLPRDSRVPLEECGNRGGVLGIERAYPLVPHLSL